MVQVGTAPDGIVLAQPAVDQWRLDGKESWSVLSYPFDLCLSEMVCQSTDHQILQTLEVAEPRQSLDRVQGKVKRGEGFGNIR